MIGRRREDGVGPSEYEPGDYGRWRGVWYCSTPNGHLGSLRMHEVTEADDGTITVTPSILIRWAGGVVCWHGFLRGGVWTD